ncbi:MAG: hypothetical protein AAF447_11260 [Myxococcota bacterium]
MRHGRESVLIAGRPWRLDWLVAEALPGRGQERLLVVSDGLRTHAVWPRVLAAAEADDTAVDRVMEALPSSHPPLIDDVSVLLLRPIQAARGA